MSWTGGRNHVEGIDPPRVSPQPVRWGAMHEMFVRRSAEDQARLFVPDAFCCMLWNQCLGERVRVLAHAESLHSDDFISFVFRNTLANFRLRNGDIEDA